MFANSKITNIVAFVIKAGLFVLPFTAFVVSSEMFFPFITGKNFFFRFMVEILFALWLVLALLDKRYRPRISPLLYAMTALLLILIFSTIFGENPYRSFWSNFERMEGLVGHLHLFAYFLILISVFKKEIEWRWFFYVLAATGAIMAFYGYLQSTGVAVISAQSGPRVDGTFGNATYLAIFMLFQAFLAFHLFLKEKKRWLKILFVTLFVFEVPVIFLTATRGTILGFLGGMGLLALLLSILSKDRRVRIAALSVIGGIILLVGVFWLAKDTNFVRSNRVLVRFSDISLSEKTVESRFTIWRMSFEGFKEHPILGWGIENYDQVFNKYYNPVLWRQEPWFDRSHNVIFDWLIIGGILGLLAYLSIFVSALYILWRRYFKEKTGAVFEPAVLTSLFAAYFFHNLFVFDNLISYYLFFSVLGFIHFRYQPQNSTLKPTPRLNLGMKELTAISGIFIALAFSLYFINAKPLFAARALLDTLRDINVNGRNVDLILSDFDKVFAYRTFGTSEAREQLSGYANNIVRSDVPDEVKIQVLTKAIQEMEEQVRGNPKSTRGFIFLSALYSYTGRNDDALKALNTALELSPKKQQIFFLVADVYLAAGQNEKALEVLQIAYDFDQSNHKAANSLATVAIVSGKQDYAEEVLEGYYGTIIIADKQLINAYARVGNYERVRDLWNKFIEQEPNNVQYRISVAAAYSQLGDKENAIKELNKAIELNPQFKEQGEFLISEIRAGRKP